MCTGHDDQVRCVERALHSPKEHVSDAPYDDSGLLSLRSAVCSSIDASTPFAVPLFSENKSALQSIGPLPTLLRHVLAQL